MLDKIGFNTAFKTTEEKIDFIYEKMLEKHYKRNERRRAFETLTSVAIAIAAMYGLIMLFINVRG